MSRGVLASYSYLGYLARGMLCLALCGVLVGCGGSRPLALEPVEGSPAVYRVTTEATTELSGAISNKSSSTEFTAALRVDPVSETEAGVEILYAAASVEGANGERVALNLDALAGERATVDFRSPGIPAGVEGSEALLEEAEVPLISMRETLLSVFPALPNEEMAPQDAWVADSPVPFSNLSGPPTRMRYVLDGVSRSRDSGRVEGYAVSSGRDFVAETVGERVSGAGELYVSFSGDYESGLGYTRTEREAEFDTNFIQLGSGGSDFANGAVHLEYASTVERLNPVEQFGLDSGGRIPD